MSDKNKIHFYNVIIKRPGKIIILIQIITLILYKKSIHLQR